MDGKHYRLDVIDTAGQEEYRDMLGSLFSADSAIDAYLLVYDISSRASLDNLEVFDELIEKNLESGLRPRGAPAPVKMVAGNKCDLAESRAVSSAEGRAWAQAHGCGFMETSAKLMVNIEEIFETLIRQVNRNRIEAAGGQVPPLPAEVSSQKQQGTTEIQPTNSTSIPQPTSANTTAAAPLSANVGNGASDSVGGGGSITQKSAGAATNSGSTATNAGAATATSPNAAGNTTDGSGAGAAAAGKVPAATATAKPAPIRGAATRVNEKTSPADAKANGCCIIS